MSKTSRWAFFRKSVIRNFQNEPYLIRWRLFQTPLFAIYLHKILKPDEGRELHDHPWNFISIVLRGAYMEERLFRGGVLGRFHLDRGAFSIAFRRAEDLHRIAQISSPLYTLVLCGRRRREWGFVTSFGVWERYDRFIERRKHAS